MAKQPFTKQAISLQAQIALLRSRGMLIQDEPFALQTLGHINYYRLGAYWLPFEADHASHTFVPGTRFEAVVDHYAFDRALRLLVLDAIERVEVALRAQLTYHLGIAHGPHALSNSAHFHVTKNRWTYATARLALEQDVRDSKEVFILHWLNNYTGPLPPIWSAVEIMTLGQLSKWYANLKLSGDRNRIARSFDCDEIMLVSFMHHLALIRNICAHHSRLWNREFAFTFKLPRTRPAAVVTALNPAAPRKLYNTLAMLACLLDGICPGHAWKSRLHDLLAAHTVPLAAMGFPSQWRSTALWAA